MNYDEQAIEALYNESLAGARRSLAELPVAEGREPSVTGLSGWVYEQTIRHCLIDELRELGHEPEVEEQVPLRGRAKLDLVVGRAAIEIKALGSFGGGDQKYVEYRKLVEERGMDYLYITRNETYGPYRENTRDIFGEDNAFFLDELGDWERFVMAVAERQATVEEPSKKKPDFDADFEPSHPINQAAADSRSLTYDPARKQYVDKEGNVVRDRFGQPL